MRVILTADLFSYSGTEFATLNLFKALQKEGINSILIVPEFKNDEISFKNVWTFKVPYNRPRTSEELYWKLTNPLFQFLFIIFLLKKIKHFRPDVLHSTGFFSTSATCFASKASRIPFISQIHDYRLVCGAESCFKFGKIKSCVFHKQFICLHNVTGNIFKSLFGVIIVIIMRFFYKKSDKILVNSDFVGRVMKEILKKDVVTFYNIVSVSFIPQNKKHENFSILYYGRLTPSKGVHMLLDVIEKMDDTSVLNIVGKNGELLNSIRNRAKNSKKIFYHGYLSSIDLYQLISDVDLVVVPSLWPEPFGLTVVEPQLIGTPVIASKIGGIPEILPSHCLFYPDQINLMRKINEVKKNPNKYRSELSCKLKPSNLIKQVLEIYTSVYENHSLPKKL